jgi:hypothetical protein
MERICPECGRFVLDGWDECVCGCTEIEDFPLNQTLDERQGRCRAGDEEIYLSESIRHNERTVEALEETLERLNKVKGNIEELRQALCASHIFSN